ncbi:OprD family outer membrane porin [Pseudomonas tohonis]|uniref:OprD family outer membrane porin n=1 Tax=Pseudomonas tohonis TaxID=2725477 RepID=UPI0035A227F4
MTYAPRTLAGLLLLAGSPVHADTTPLADWSLLARNYLLDNEFRSTSPSGQAYRREWAQGFIANLESALTPGTLGLGVDLHAFLGLKLDGGRGHAGTGLLPLDSDGASEREYASAGGALKLSFADTLLRVGEMTVETPVFDTADKRLQPEYATGWFLDSQALEALRLQAGRFTAFRNQAASSGHNDFDGYGASTRHGGISLAGARWAPAGSPLGGALYASQLDDTWRQAYANLNGRLGDLALDANLYRTRDTGERRAGRIDTLAYSLLGRLALGSHALSLAYQKVEGDTPFDFVGGDSIYLANSIKYADFNGPGERSWQARYQWDASAAGWPGLTLSARYVRGSGIDGSHAPQGGAYAPFDDASGRFQPQQGSGGRHWERDLDLRYTLQSGPARDLALSLAHVTHRANDAQAGADIDRLYLIVEYPLGGSL